MSPIQVLALASSQPCVREHANIQQVLTEPEWQGRLTAVDLRALSPLKWQHVNPYGTFTLDMNQRLPLEQMAFPCSAALPKFRASLP